ncbi:regulatory protein RecX [Nocardia sp. NPDC059177]|uniref:regulatory protein RecX n=1 Tax=Nocardia sp. NPDC059177 TaxID=3346759 RepID=UPI0036BAA21E
MRTPNPGRARRDPTDPVEDMRRQLARLGIEVEREQGTATELVRPARDERAGPDARGIRSGAGDPQRAHPTGFADCDQSRYSAARTGDDHEEWGSGARPRRARRGRESGRRDADSLSTGVGGDDGRQADPVAAGSEPGEPDRRAGTRRLAPGDRPAATVDQAKDACLNLLAVRARSRAELAKRLGEKGFRLEVTDAALDRLTEVGLIDDTAFAEQWVHERHTYSGRGKKALQRELRDKGVAPGDAETALAAVTDDAERARATDLVRRKLATLSRELDRDKAVRRLVGMLARRGYDQATAFAVVTTELADALDDPAETDDERRSVRKPVPGDEQAAVELVRRKLRTLPADLDRAKATRRLVDMLARRGYRPSVAYAVVKAELAEAGEVG